VEMPIYCEQSSKVENRCVRGYGEPSSINPYLTLYFFK
jgi:hypothetical protein